MTWFSFALLALAFLITVLLVLFIEIPLGVNALRYTRAMEAARKRWKEMLEVGK